MPTETPTTKSKPPASGNGTDTPTTWYVVLHLVDGRVEPQLEWWREMKVHDKVHFMSPNGTVQVKFTPEDAKDKNGHTVTGLFPFGKDHEVILADSKKEFEVIHSCKSLMSCSIVKDGVVYTYHGRLAPGARWPDKNELEDEDSGTHVCTGGGGNPVVCG